MTETVENTPETAYTFEELEAALEGKQPPVSPDSEQESSQSDDDTVSEKGVDGEAQVETPESITAKDLAESLGLSERELYKRLKVKIDGQEFSLSEFKDKAAQFHSVEQLKAKALEGKIKAESDLLQKSMALEEAVAALGRPLNQRDIELAQQKQELHSKAQAALLAEIVPEFADPVERDKGLQLIGATLEDYAFSKAQIPYITDARLRKMAYDLGTLRNQLAGILETEVKPKVNQRPKAHTPVTPIVDKSARNTRQSSEAAVAKLAKLL